MFAYFIEEFHHSFADVVQFTGVCIPVLGFSNLFWSVPPFPPKSRHSEGRLPAQSPQNFMLICRSMLNFCQDPGKFIIRKTSSSPLLNLDLSGQQYLGGGS